MSFGFYRWWWCVSVFATGFLFWKYGVYRCFGFYVFCQYRVDLVPKALQIPASVSEIYILSWQFCPISVLALGSLIPNSRVNLVTPLIGVGQSFSVKWHEYGCLGRIMNVFGLFCHDWDELGFVGITVAKLDRMKLRK